MNQTIRTKPRQPKGGALKLTKREKEILLYADKTDASSLEIGQALYISKRTVDFHLANVYAKLHVTKRIRAIKEARSRGLI